MPPENPDPNPKDRETEAARLDKVLTAISGAITALLALFAFLSVLSDPETGTVVLAAAALVVWILVWPVRWYGPAWAVLAMLAVWAATVVAAVWVEACDSPPPEVDSWRVEHRVQLVDPEISTGNHPRAIAADGRYVWVVGKTTDEARGLLWRIDSKNVRPVAEAIHPFHARDPYDIAVGEKAVWVTDEDRLIKLDLEGDEVWSERFGDGGENEVDVRFGKVWLKETTMGKVFVVDPDSGEELRDPVDVGPKAVAIAVGLGSVWVSGRDEGGDPAVIRLDRKGGVMDAIPVQDDPQDLAAGGRYLYVAHSNEQLVTRIDPEQGRFGAEVPGPRELEKKSGAFGGIDANGRTVWVVLDGEGATFAIAECNFRLIWRLKSGDSPFDVVILGGKAFVPNYNGGDVTMFRLRKPVCR